MVGPLLIAKMIHCKRLRDKASKSKSSSRNKDSDRKPSRGDSSQSISLKVEPVEDDGKTCRVCLKEGDIPIYGNDFYEDVSDGLSAIAAIDVKTDDEFPKKLCESCYSTLQAALTLRHTAQQSEQYLKKSDELNLLLQDDELMATDDLDFSYYDDSVNDSDFKDYQRPKKSKDVITCFYCKKCNMEFKTEEEFMEHRLTFDHYSIVKDSGFEDYQRPIKSKEVITCFHCRKCNIDFKTEEEYTEHRFTIDHYNIKVPCPVCGKMYQEKYLKIHMKYHKEPLNICDICGKKFIQMGQFTRHRETHFIDKLPFQCNLCPYKGRYSESLKMHMRSHTGEKPYQCPECPMRFFVNKSNLSRHLLTHRNEHNFKCSQCQRGFYTKKELDLHYKVDHTGIKDHICDICGKAFGYRKQMMKHQVKVHKRSKMRSGRTPLYILKESKRMLLEEGQGLEDEQRNIE